MARRLAPEVNAGSMADIAFLLLIFFLVTTTIETDVGISRKLPPLLEKPPQDIHIKERNLFRVEINIDNQLLVEEQMMDVKGLKKAAVAFLDNGGAGVSSCTYCMGNRDHNLSDSPEKAVISLVNDRETSYEMYIAVQNELLAAYTSLRNREARRKYGISYEEMLTLYKEASDSNNKGQLKAQLTAIRAMYPEKLSETEPVKQ